MTKPLRIGRENDVDNAVVSGSSAISSLPASNVKDEDIARIWRSTGSPAYLIADIGQTLTLGVTALLNTTGRTTDTYRVRASTSDATVTSSLSYDSGSISAGVDPVYGSFIHFIEPAVSYRYLRIDMTQTDTPEAGRWMSGQAWIPSRHFSFGWQPIWRDQSRRVYSLGQNVFTDIQKRNRGYRFTLRGLTTDEVRSEVAELNRLRGIGRDILVCLDKDSTNLSRDTIWGLMEEPAVPTQIDRDLWEAEFMMWERL